MTDQRTHLIGQTFGKQARSYNQHSQIQKHIAKSLTMALPFSFRPKKILEIGCGTGHLTYHLLAIYPDAEITALDISPHMLDHVKERFKGEDRLTTLLGDGNDLNLSLPLKGQHFDLIISNMTVQWLTDINASYTNWMSFLQDNGYIATSRPAKNAFQEWRAGLDSFGYPNTLISYQQTEIEHTTLSIKQEYTNTFDFLQTVKNMGASYSDKANKLTPKQIKDMCEYCDKNHDATFTWDAQIDLATIGH